MANKVNITPGFFLLGAMALLLLPFRWIMGGLLAAVVHELFHCIAVLLCGGQVRSLSLGSFGAKMEASPMNLYKSTLCALAGPAGSFFMLLAAEHFPETAICGLIQGAYNLLPIYPLDGGRILRCLLPDPICYGIQIFTIVFLSGFGIWIMTHNLEIGIILLLSIWYPFLQRKLSCKEAR